MAEITETRGGEMRRATIQVVLGHPDGLRARDVFVELAKFLPPTPFESEDYPNRPGVRRYEKVVRFRSIKLVKAGWLVKTAGIWTVTDEGKRAFETLVTAAAFNKEVNRLYKEWADSRPAGEPEDAEDEEASAAATLEDAQDAAWAEIEAYLGKMQAYDFQNLVAGLLRGMGYHVAWVAPPGADGGMDILAFTDPLGAKGPRIKVQVKRQASKTDPRDIRSFIGVLADDDIGIFVSSGGYTREAEAEARKQERKRLMLLDLRKMYELWVEHYDSVQQSDRALLPLRKVYYLDRS